MMQIEDFLHQLRVKEAREGKMGTEGAPAKRPIAVSASWLASFLGRTKSLKLAPARVIEEDRSKNSTKEEIDRYVNNLASLFAQHEYDPSMVANFDETFLMWGCNRWKVVTRATNKADMVKEMQINEHVTLCATIFGDGSTIPALVILPLVYLPNEINPKDWPKFDWTGQANGWITKDIFESYCLEVLIPHFNRRRKDLPANKQRGLLIVDGHSSRLNAKLMKAFRDNNIDVLIIPAHTSHILQPLDLCFFGIFKRRLRVFPEFKYAQTAGQKRIALLTSAQFSFEQASATYYITRSFFKAGIIPLNTSRLMTHHAVLQAPTPAYILQTVPSKKRGDRPDISNSILTDRVEELEEYEIARAAKQTSKKRKQTEAPVEQPKAKKAKRVETVQLEEADDAQEAKEANLVIPRECILCGHHSTHGAKTWTSCDQCDDIWICTGHPTGLAGHYAAAHPQDEVPTRRRRANPRVYQGDYCMDDDDE